MNDQLSVLLVFWKLQFSAIAQENMTSEMKFTNDGSGDKKNHSTYYRRILVKYDTLIEHGALVFSKPGVDAYSAIKIDDVQRPDWNEAIYVGARNWLFKLDMALNETEAVGVAAAADEVSECQKGKPTGDCHNFIKTIHVEDTNTTTNGKIFVCGTNAYAPACSYRDPVMLTKEIHRIPRFGPGNPRGGTAAYLTGNRLFFGFVGNSSNNSSDTISAVLLNEGGPVMRTYESLYWLHRAEFAGAFSPSKYDKFVYIVFREVAAEDVIAHRVVSRVARICKDDEGGPWIGGENHFSSYTKARLYCSDQHTKVQSISYQEKDPYFWATFADENNGTAICRFSIANLEYAFRGPYLTDHDDNKWEVRPPPYLMEGDAIAKTCFGLRSDEAVRAYTLMSRMVTQNCPSPHFVTDAALHKIVVSSEIQGTFTAFAGDDEGRVRKIGFSGCDVLGDVQVWEAVPSNQSIKDINGLVILNSSIIALTNERILKIPTEDDYPGEIIEERTTAATTKPSDTMSEPNHRTGEPAGTTGPTKSRNENDSPRIASSSSFNTMVLTLTAIICGINSN